MMARLCEHCWHISRANRQPRAPQHGRHAPADSYSLKTPPVRRIQTCCWCGTTERHDPAGETRAIMKRLEKLGQGLDQRLAAMRRKKTR
jgi:hypothetical protein